MKQKAPHLRGVVDTEGETVSEESTPGDADVGVPDHWPGRSDVAKAIGKTATTVRNLEIRNKLHPVKDKKGEWRFDPEEIAELCVEMGIQTDDVEKWKSKAYGRVDLYSSLQAMSLLQQSVKSVSIATAKQDLRVERYMDRLEAENKRLNKQVDELRGKLDASHEEREKVRSQNVDDQAIQAIVQSQQARDERVLRILGSLGENVKGFLFGGESTDQNPSAFLNTLDLDKLEALAERMGDVLTKDHLEAIQRAYSRKIEEAKAKAEAPKGEPTNAA